MELTELMELGFSAQLIQTYSNYELYNYLTRLERVHTIRKNQRKLKF